MLGLSTALLATASLTTAWWPHERDMSARAGGSNLFEVNSTTVYGEDMAKRWLPGNLPIRGVNLGSLFIMEKWMSSTEWSNVGCGSTETEFDCTIALGQSTANKNFAKHWNTFITQADLKQMASYGLNTIRIPVGYWIFAKLKYPSEHFPEGQMQYLKKICGWASDLGFYIIIDLHGAPFGQANNPFTGQAAGGPSESSPKFYQSSQYQRALWFLGNMTQTIHQNGGPTGVFRNVGMLEIVNEPIGNPPDLAKSMRQHYYPAAFKTIRQVERGLGVSSNNELHIQMMNNKWGSGDPTQYLTDIYFASYDDHRYLKWDPSVAVSQSGYVSASCNDDRGGNWPTVVGEWSLSVKDANQFDSQFWPIANNLAFYRNWFNAQVRAYEKQDGWIFWSWKTSGLNDPRWDYQMAVSSGIIPKDLNTIYNTNPC